MIYFAHASKIKNLHETKNHFQKYFLIIFLSEKIQKERYPKKFQFLYKKLVTVCSYHVR